MKTNEKNITKHILIPLSLTLFFLLTISIMGIYLLQRVHLNDEVEKRLKETEQLFKMKLDEEAKILESQINFLQFDKNIQNAYQVKDREALLHHAKPYFKVIRKKYQVTHFYFINMDKICFLRVHNPQRYGDTVPRFTLADTMRKDEPVYGIELGKFGTFTLRLVYPWRINGSLIGYIELGKEIEHITLALKKILGVELFFLIKKSFLNRADWEEGLRMMGRVGDWTEFSQFVIIDKTMPTIPKAFKKLEPLLSHSKDELKTLLNLTLNHKQYSGGFVPLIDAGNRKLGDIFVLNDVSKQEMAQEILLILLTMFSIFISSGLLLFFYSFVNEVEFRLLKYHNDLIATEKSKNKLAKEKIEQQHQFLQRVIDSFDHPFHVINANNYQIELSNSATQALGLLQKITCYALTHKRSQPCTGINNSCPLEKVKKTKKPTIVEHIHFDEKGNPINVEVHGFPIIDNTGNVNQMIEYALDITERKQFEKQLHQQNEELQVQNDKLDAFSRQLEELQKEKVNRINKAYERFIPNNFFRLLDKRSIIEVELGDQVEKEMAILFSDIRGFTRISEKMTPQNNFDFLNAYLSRMEPIIGEHHGFIDKYIGDGIMALFPTADDALQAAIGQLKKLKEYNMSQGKSDFINIGIGINTGSLMLGIVGGKNRMDGTVVSDAVNLASRVEQLTKNYGTALLITEHTYNKLTEPHQYQIRMIDVTQVKGKKEEVTIYEVFDADHSKSIALKNETRSYFEAGFMFYHHEKFNKAKPFFEKLLQINPNDNVAQVYLKRCHNILSTRMPEYPEILIVDDVPLNLKLLSDILDSNNLKVTFASDGKTALEIAQLKYPHLILLDVMMPEMDGFEVCRQLKANPKTKNIPIIFLTALSEMMNKVKGFDLGGVDYITKPFHPKEVLIRVKTHLHLSHLQRQRSNDEW
ncbi:MAG: response regulator [Thiomargarita sp.]|nr:response regulator [Thiomargarita sp.]